MRQLRADHYDNPILISRISSSEIAIGNQTNLRSNKGREFIAMTPANWAEHHGVTLEFIKPGKPMENGLIDRFNRSYREAVLDMLVFQSLNDLQEQTEK